METLERVRTNQVEQHIGHETLMKGWLRAVRRLGGVTFLTLRDGWGELQVVVDSEQTLAPLTTAGAGVESVVSIEGRLTLAPQAPGGVELHATRITPLTAVREAPPITLSKRELRANLTTLLDHAVLANRHPTRRAIFALTASALNGFRSTLQANGFTELQTPKIVAAATESGANVFQLDYFGRPAFLAQSPQLYKQVMVGVFERVFEVGPVFRAEPHDTTRHLNAYTSLDLEMGFIDSYHDVMAILRDTLAGMLAAMAEQRPAELRLLNVTLPVVPPTIPTIDFSAAQQLIFEQTGQDTRGEPDLAPQDERWLGAWALEQFASDFLFVTGYPRRKRPFYTHPDPQRPDFTNSFDLLFRGTELVSGGQRLHRYEDYLAALEREGLPLAPFAWFLDAYKYGMPPHGGLGMGLERLLMQLIGLPNVKLVALFPRDINRLTP